MGRPRQTHPPASSSLPPPPSPKPKPSKLAGMRTIPQKSASPISLLFSPPRLLHYGATLLRVDPCLRIVVIRPSKSFVDSVLTEEGLSRAELDEFFSHADHLK